MSKPDLSYSQLVTATTCTIVTARPLALTQETSPPAGSFSVPEDKDLLVLGDVVSIRGRIRLPGKSVRVLARTLKLVPVAGASGRRAAEINVDGRDADPPDNRRAAPDTAKKGDIGVCLGLLPRFEELEVRPGTKGNDGTDGLAGAPGKPGGHAGEIVVMCESFSPDQPLTLSAKGGKGGDGQDGQNGGRGGDGGNGADGEEGVGWGSLGFKLQSSGGDGGNGGSGGPGGNGGDGGHGGRVVFRAVNPNGYPATRIICFADRGLRGKPGEGGQPGDGGDAGRAGAAPSLRSRLPGGVHDGKPGKRSTSGNVRGAEGTDGLGGSVERLVDADYSDVKAALASAFR
jgi:hypothetical protein